MTAPERIWARPDYNECWPKRLEEEDVEYIRADLAAVQPAQVRDVCSKCFGTGMRIGDNGDPSLCNHCHGDTVEPQPDQTVEIDLRAAMMEELEKAASESPWVPEEYYMNEVINDCCAFLRSDRPQPDPRDEVIARLVEALEMMRSTYPYNPPCYGWQEQVEAHKAAKAALAAAKAVQQ